MLYEHPIENLQRLVFVGYEAAALYRERLRAAIRLHLPASAYPAEGVYLPEYARFVEYAKRRVLNEGFSSQRIFYGLGGSLVWGASTDHLSDYTVASRYGAHPDDLIKAAKIWTYEAPSKRWAWMSPETAAHMSPALRDELYVDLIFEGNLPEGNLPDRMRAAFKRKSERLKLRSFLGAQAEIKKSRPQGNLQNV